MALQSYNIAVGNLTDDSQGNNYSVNAPVYITTENLVSVPIYKDLAGTIPIPQNGVDNTTDENGTFTFYVEAGQYLANVGGTNYIINVVGSDYFDSRIDETIAEINEQNKLVLDNYGKKFNLITVFDFATGGTLETSNQCVRYTDGNSYQWQGLLPKTVNPGDNPTSPDWLQVTFNEIDNISGLSDELQKRAATYNYNDAVLADLDINTSIQITDMENGIYTVVDIADTGGFYIDYSASKKLRLIYGNKVNLSWSVTPNDTNTNKAIELWDFAIADGIKDFEFTNKTTNFTGNLGSDLFVAEDVDNLSVTTNGALFNVNASSGNGIVNVFHLKGCNEPNIDSIYCYTPRSNADNGEVIQALLIEESDTRKTSSPVCPFVYAKNGSGIRIQCAQSSYQSDGFESDLRSDGIKSEIYIDQTERTFNTSNDYAGYGINIAFAGDDTKAEVKCIGAIHRMYHVYGCQRVEINGYAEESSATPFLISTFGGVVGFQSKVELNQKTPRPNHIAYVNPRGVGATGGVSADVLAGREHKSNDIDLDVSVLNPFTVGAFATSGLTVDKTEASSDSSFSFKGMKLRLNMPDVAASEGVQFLPSAATQNTANISVSDIEFFGCEVLNCNSRFTKVEGQTDWIKIKDSSLLTAFANASTSSPTGPGLIYDNTTVQLGVDESNTNSGVLVQVINGSRLSARANTDTLPFGKLFRDSYLGDNGDTGGNQGVYIESKGYFDVFTSWDTSDRNRNPTGVERDVILGRTNLTGVEATPLNTVIRGTTDLSSSASDLYIPQLVVGGPVGADNPREVTIAVRPSGSTGWAIASGYIAIYGGGNDLTTAIINMDITSVMDNASGQTYTTSDFSVSATSSSELTFSCSVAAADMIVTVQR